MFICPTCSKEFDDESVLVKHFLKCWKDTHPCHQAKSAPRSEDITTREVSNEIADFFNALQKR